MPERDWVLPMALDLVAATPWAGEHTILRGGETGGHYSVRALKAAALNLDLVICHHVNAGPAGLDGLMCFHLPGDHLAQETGDAVMRAAPAKLLQRKAKSTPATSDDWTRDAHAVMGHYDRRGIRVLLIEWGFSTAPVDLEVLLSSASRPALCVAGAAGLARLIELTHPR
jgi:N-acetylmuramoyl-L-alanine amidase